MALRTLTRTLRYLHPLALHSSRYPLLPFSSRFLTIDLIQDPSPPYEPSDTQNITELSERSIIEQLYELLPIDPKPSTPRALAAEKPPQTPTTPRVSDVFLSPDEQLRGIFLQKLRGRSTVEYALSATGVDLTSEIFGDVLNRGNLGGAAMVTFFDWAVQQPKVSKSVDTYNVMLNALGRRKFFNFMEEFALRMKNDGIKPNSETLEILMDSFVRARQVSKAIQIFKRLEEMGSECDSNSFSILIQCLCLRSHVTVATTLFNSMRGKIPFDTTTYNGIIGGWTKFGRIDKVESYWSAMKRDGLIPDHLTYCYLIEALGRVGKINDAVEVFETMDTNGCVPNAATYNAIIANFISVGDLEKSKEYYVGMQEKNCPPDADTFERLITAFLKVRMVADALELFDDMLGQGVLPSTGMITSFIEPLCRFGPPHAALMIYKKSRKAGCRISMKTYKLLLMRLSRFGKCGTLLKIWEEMQESGYDSDMEVYEYIVNGLCNIGQVDNAVLVVEESLRRGFCLGKIVYSKLNSKLMKMNRVEIAYKLFLKVKEARKDANSQSFWRANGWHF